MSKLLSESLLAMYFEALRKVLFSEYFLWLLAGFAVAARFFIAYNRTPELVYTAIEEHYFELLLGALVALFPFVFYQIFGKSPLHAIRDRKADGENKNIVIHGNGNVIQVAKDKASTEEGEVAQSTAQLLFQLAKNAEYFPTKSMSGPASI